MRFTLEQRPDGWIDSAPVRITQAVDLPATPDEVFTVLADHEGWTRWFGGMRRVHIDGPASGVGALRTVSVPPARVQERFVAWAPGERLLFDVVRSNLPGLRAMTEDWRLAPSGDGTRLTITIGVDPAGPLRLVPGLVRWIVARSTRGARGIVQRFSGSGTGNVN